MTLGPASTPPTIATGAAATAGAAAIGSAPKAPAETPAAVDEEEEEDDDALVLLPPPARCRELLAGGYLSGAALQQRNANIDGHFGQPFRLAHPAAGLLAGQSQTRDAVAARRALLHHVHLYVVRIARRAGVGPCASHRDFGTARDRTGALCPVLWPVAAACLSHVPALSEMKKVRTAFASSFPGGMQAAPEWSSAAGLSAAALLERELLARFDGEAFTTATPVADVRRAHLPVLLHWTSAQLASRAASADVERRCPAMVACLRSGRTAAGLARRAVQRSGWLQAQGQTVMLDRAVQATALGVQSSLGSPPHYALALAALGPLHTPSDVAELGGETTRLKAASALGKLVLGRLLGVTVHSLTDYMDGLRKGAHYATVPLVTATSAGLGTVRRLLALDEPGWEEMLSTILSRLLQERRRLQMPTAAVAHEPAAVAHELAAVAHEPSSAVAPAAAQSASQAALVHGSVGSSSRSSGAAAATALLPLALGALADFEGACNELAHAPAIKHVPYAAREGALAGSAEREAHHLAGRETMATLEGRGFGALHAAIADPTVRLPHAGCLVEAVPRFGLGALARLEARIADVGEAAALAVELGLHEHGAVEHCGLACALLNFVRVGHLESLISWAGGAAAAAAAAAALTSRPSWPRRKPCSCASPGASASFGERRCPPEVAARAASAAATCGSRRAGSACCCCSACRATRDCPPLLWMASCGPWSARQRSRGPRAPRPPSWRS